MSGAAAWRWCLAAGLAALACAWGFGRIPGLVACGPGAGANPILAFEFARTPADVARLFGAEPCRSTLAAAQRTGLWLDALGFIPAYTAFLCLAAWAAGRQLAWPVIAALLVAALSDEIEGALLFAVLHGLPGDEATLDALAWAVGLKFLLLGLATLAIAALLLGQWRGFRWSEWTVARIVGGLGVGYLAVAALRGYFADAPGAMTTGFAGAWFVLLLVATFGAAWPWRAPYAPPRAPAPPNA